MFSSQNQSAASFCCVCVCVCLVENQRGNFRKYWPISGLWLSLLWRTNNASLRIAAAKQTQCSVIFEVQSDGITKHHTKLLDELAAVGCIVLIKARVWTKALVAFVTNRSVCTAVFEGMQSHVFGDVSCHSLTI